MSNTLITVLNDSGGPALVEEYLEKKFLERRDYDTTLANSTFAQKFRIPMNDGQSVKLTRKNRFREPEKKSNTNRTADPASGAAMGTEVVKLPLEYIHEYTGIGTVASWTSWIDLKEWADEDLTMAVMRREHKLTQNAFKVGRMLPGKWSADPAVASVAFDASAEPTVTVDGASFTFESAPKAYVGAKSAFNDLDPQDRFTMADFHKAGVQLANAGAMKINGALIAVISDAIKEDLFLDDEYFRTIVDAFKGKGVVENTLVKYRSWWWLIDDEPFTEDYNNEGVRATNGPVHTAICFGANSFGYVPLGEKGPGQKPVFKVQDITKTGSDTTIGYTIPFQVGLSNRLWTKCIMGPVSTPESNA